jgi:hypothetical protein
MTDQVNIGQQVEKQTDRMTKEVHSSDNADWHDKKKDAKEKGSNEYAGDGGKRRKTRQKTEQVVVKGHQGFDVKI